MKYIYFGWNKNVTGYILATRFSATTNITAKISHHRQQNRINWFRTIEYHENKVREGGRTVGSGRVATIIE